jgi:RNA polymerase sigma-70 factor (ECF subfamily)
MRDAEIVQWHRAGEREASLRRFAEMYQPRLYTLARRLLGNHDDALDALQEILMQIDKSLPTFKGDSSLYTWAFRLATNICLNYAKRLDRAKDHTPLDDAFLEAVLLPMERPTDNPDVMCRTQFRQYLVEQALLKLPDTQRAVLVLCDLEEMTAPEVAKVVGIQANAVKSRLHRARATLKRIIDQEFEALGVDVDGMHTFECTWQYLTAASSSPASPAPAPVVPTPPA